MFNTGAFSYDGRSVGYLMLSSTLGIVIGDVMWLEALRRIGARRVIVVDSIKPFAAAILGQFLLNEKLKPLAWLGMIVTVTGLLIVTLEKERIDNNHDFNDSKTSQAENIVLTENSNGLLEVSSPSRKSDINCSSHHYYCVGYLFALSNALFDTWGSFLTKKFGFGMTIWEVNLVRFAFASFVMIILSCVLCLFHRITAKIAPCLAGHKLSEKEVTTHMSNSSESSLDLLIIPESDDELSTSIYTESQKSLVDNDPSPWYCLPSNMSNMKWLLVTLGVVFVTFLCPAMSTYGLFLIPLGLALTLGSTGPLYALPLTFFIQKQKPTVRGCVGAALAFAGIVMLSASGHTAPRYL